MKTLKVPPSKVNKEFLFFLFFLLGFTLLPVDCFSQNAEEEIKIVLDMGIATIDINRTYAWETTKEPTFLRCEGYTFSIEVHSESTPLPRETKIEIIDSDRFQEESPSLDLWEEDQYIYARLTLPENYEITNKNELEAGLKYRSTKDNEVIFRLKVPAFLLEIDETGTMNAEAQPFALLYLVFGLVWRRRKRFRKRGLAFWEKQEEKSERELIAEGELKRALQKLLKHRQLSLNADLCNEVTLLLSRISFIDHSKQRGLIDYDHFSRERNRVSDATLKLLTRLET